jgi:hypothetical protein
MQGDVPQVGESVLEIGELAIRYYLREPSPDHWNAVGVITRSRSESLFREPDGTSMIVGVGTSQDEAIRDLVKRVVTGEHRALARIQRLTHATKQVSLLV